MKIQIRRGVFETNSSSTHSLQITKGSIDSVRDNIFKAIIEQYKENIDNDMFNPLLCIDKENKTFTLTGIYFENGDECGNVYYIISNWIAKLQYIAMALNENAYYIEDYNRDAYRTTYFENEYHDTLLTDTKVYARFVERIKEYTKSKGYDIVHVINNLEYGVYTETIENTDTHVKYFSEHGNNKWITVDEFDKFFDDVMKDENIITFQDIAYAPYNKPKIYIL